MVSGLPLCPLYCNTLLANLNARAYLGGGETSNVISMDLFASSRSQASKTTKTAEQPKLVSSAKQVGFHSSNWYRYHGLIISMLGYLEDHGGDHVCGC